MKPASVELLRKVMFFSGLTGEVLDWLAARTRRRVYPAHTVLFQHGDHGNCLYVVASGIVSIQRMGVHGQTVHIAHRGPGEAFGELALIDGEPRMADAVTTTECDLLRLGCDDFLSALERYPRMALPIIRCLANRLREAADDGEYVTVDVTARVCRLLLDLKETYGADPVPGGHRLRVVLTQQVIGERIRATREAVNRAFADLKKAGVVRVDGREIVILRESELRREH
jgi:CRP-like cAMP-binding protein